MRLLLINGASGSGKTTLAQALSDRIESLLWIHPDGLMDTPDMTAEEILERSLSGIDKEHRGGSIVIDCQIRPGSIAALVSPRLQNAWAMVLLHAPREIREQRLSQRGWSAEDFERIERWAALLVEESQDAGWPIFDTSVRSVESLVTGLEEKLSEDL